MCVDPSTLARDSPMRMILVGGMITIIYRQMSSRYDDEIVKGLNWMEALTLRWLKTYSMTGFRSQFGGSLGLAWLYCIVCCVAVTLTQGTWVWCVAQDRKGHVRLIIVSSSQSLRLSFSIVQST